MIYDGEGSGKRYAAMIYGTSSPAYIANTYQLSRTATITFTSDDSVAWDGFVLTVRYAY